LSVEDLKTALANYEDILTFELVGEVIKIIPKDFIPKPKWEAINEQVKQLNGRYVGGIKERHWTVKRETRQVPQQTAKGNELVLDAIDLLEKALTKLREAGY